MSSFVLKLIAIIAMLLDHSNDALIGHFTILNLIGRIAFPIFCFQLVIGYTHTHDVKKYLLRLLAFAIISQIPYSLFMHSYIGSYLYLNVFFTLLFAVTILYIIDSKKINIFLKITSIPLLMLIAQVTKMDYGAFGIALTIVIYSCYPFADKINRKLLTQNKFFNIVFYLFSALAIITISDIKYINFFPIIKVIELIIASYFSIILTLFYNGKKGPSIKYFFYVFYPVHLLILYILSNFIK